MADRPKLMIEMKAEDGWYMAHLVMGNDRPELCRMVSPSRNASGREKIMDAFQALAVAIVTSIIRDEQPEAEVETRVFNVAEPGHG